MLAVPRHRSGQVLTPPAQARSSFFAPARLQARNSLPEMILKVFFCRYQAQDLRQIRAPRNLTNRQSAAKLWICLRVCADQF